ncbi:MAG: alpha/beta hydrolase [Ferruginibacter sp.]|nr:alpha/beta hydrolase [Ferruginibacter sp.]
MKHIFLSFFVLCQVNVYAQSAVNLFKDELIYGRKDGMALTMFVQVPGQSANGKGIIIVESGNWKSSYERALRFLKESRIYTDKGYTVFTVLPGSQPRYTIPDQVADLKRAIRFIRYNAKAYGIDPGHIGIMGFSSGGHLSLAVATADNKIDSTANDPVDRVSSRVQAVAVFYPPTDFLNFGKQQLVPSVNRSALILTGVYAAFDFKTFNDTTRSYVPITDDSKKLEIARQVSPIYSVSPDDPPVLIMHGDADILVPLQQSESIIKKFIEAKVPNQLIIKKGAGHGWKNNEAEIKTVIDWFDKYLK